jgi:hypothetical protein
VARFQLFDHGQICTHAGCHRATAVVRQDATGSIKPHCCNLSPSCLGYVFLLPARRRGLALISYLLFSRLAFRVSFQPSSSLFSLVSGHFCGSVEPIGLHGIDPIPNYGSSARFMLRALTSDCTSTFFVSLANHYGAGLRLRFPAASHSLCDNDLCCARVSLEQASLEH